MPADPVTPSAAPLTVDIAILGAGAAGTSAAAALANAGQSVALVDIHEHYPHDFRAEKIGVEQMNFLEKFGLGEVAHQQMTAFDGVWVHRFGRIIEKKTTREFAASYGDVVNALRRGLPKSVNFLVGRVDDIATGPEQQTLTLGDGRQVRARLLILATGLIDAARRKLGIGKTVVSPDHSLAIGFDLANRPADYPFPSLVWTVERPSDQGAYLSIFPIGDGLRVNLFVYRKANDPWTRAFRLDPVAGVHALLPDFEPLFGRIAVEGTVSARPIDLLRAEGFQRDGVVLIGDAYFTVCPITGTGMDKALHDADRLCNHYIPRWLATPGMGADKIAQFYADPAKQARDAHATAISYRARDMRMNNALPWRMRRLKSAILTRNAYRLRNLVKPVDQPPRRPSTTVRLET